LLTCGTVVPTTALKVDGHERLRYEARIVVLDMGGVQVESLR